MASHYSSYDSRNLFLAEVRRAKRDYPSKIQEIDDYREYIEGRANYIGFVNNGGGIFQMGIKKLHDDYPPPRNGGRLKGKGISFIKI